MRRSVPAAIVAFALGICIPLLSAAPAFADATVAPSPSASAAPTPFVEANPSTVPAGDEIAIRASCIDNLKNATVTSGPFGTVTVKYQNGFLTGKALIPETTRVGNYVLTLSCPDPQATATGTLHVVAQVAPTQGPATGGGGTAPGRNAPLLIGGGAAALVLGLLLAAASLIRRRRFG
jgi:hypothetical protein